MRWKNTFLLTRIYHFVIFARLEWAKSDSQAGVAQLVERDLAKVEVTGSSPATRSIVFHEKVKR
jgi:hypothetical protein